MVGVKGLFIQRELLRAQSMVELDHLRKLQKEENNLCIYASAFPCVYKNITVWIMSKGLHYNQLNATLRLTLPYHL